MGDARVEAVITRTLESAPPGATHWSSRGMAAASGLSVSNVQRIWRAFGLQPHRLGTFEPSTDPDFVAKVRDVVGLYMARAGAGAVRRREEPDPGAGPQPADAAIRPGRPARRSHDYTRHGTTSLFAARVAAHREAAGSWGLLEDWLAGGGGDSIGAAAGAVRLGGEVAGPGFYSVGELRGLPAVTQAVTYGTGRGPVTNTYTGVLLADLLADAGGVTTDPAAKNDILAHYVVATGADGYRAVFSLGEIEPRFGDEPIAVAYAAAAVGELGPEGTAGSARMVVPGDKAGGRYVSNMVGIEVIDTDTDLATRGDPMWG